MRGRRLSLREAPPASARVVSTASAAHQGARLDFDDLQSAKSFSAMKAYGRSAGRRRPHRPPFWNGPGILLERSRRSGRRLRSASLGASASQSSIRWLGQGIGQRLGEASDREIRRRRAIDDRRNGTGPQEGEGSEQTDVPFALGLPFDNLGEGGNAAEPESSFDPSPGALAMAVRRASGSRVSSLALRPGHE